MGYFIITNIFFTLNHNILVFTVDLSQNSKSIETWIFLYNMIEKKIEECQNNYKSIIKKLKLDQNDVVLWTDANDGTSLTWHDERYIIKVRYWYISVYQ